MASAADLDHRLVEGDPLEVRIVEADLRDPVDHGDRGRGHPGLGQHLLERPGGGEVARPRQSVRDDRRLERHHGPPGRERGLDGGR
jgi:hypothetical protein